MGEKEQSLLLQGTWTSPGAALPFPAAGERLLRGGIRSRDRERARRAGQWEAEVNGLTITCVGSAAWPAPAGSVAASSTKSRRRGPSSLGRRARGLPACKGAGQGLPPSSKS